MELENLAQELPADVPRQSVLIVDDSPTDQLYMRKLVERDDRHVLTARSGEEALIVLKGFECALVLMDIQLDGMNGFQTAEAIRSYERFRNLPIIFISATSQDQEHVFRGYDAGAVDYLFKPVEPNLLRSKINVFCELAEQRFVIQEQLREIQSKNEVLLRQIEEIKTLRGLVPICARCKNVRDDSGFWQTIEAYVCEHSEAEFSHSVCPECAEVLYPGIGPRATTAAGVRAGRPRG